MPSFVIEESQNKGYKRIHVEGCKDCIDPEFVGEFDVPSDLYDALANGGYGYDEYEADELESEMMACAFKAFKESAKDNSGEDSELIEALYANVATNDEWLIFDPASDSEPEMITASEPYYRGGHHIGTAVALAPSDNPDEPLFSRIYLTTDTEAAEAKTWEAFQALAD